jgi:protein ImuB
MRRRIVSVALPWLAAEHRLRAEGQSGLDSPFAVVERAAGTLRLAGVNRAAGRTGLAAGMGLSDARAICPGLLTRPAAPERLAGFVRALARWAERFSPLVGQDLGPSLALDATGVAHLFGGEQAMLDALAAALAERGLTARAAIADTKGAAWALAHHGTGRTALAPPGRTRQAIGDLPVAALRLDADTAQALATVGLATIEPLTRMPRGALARRFGIEAMRRLDQALGAEPEPVAPEARLPAFSARLTCPEPIGLVADVTAALELLLERLCSQLETHLMGARRLRLTARRVDGADGRAEIRLARPGRDPMRLRDLFAPKLGEIDAGFGIDALRLAALEVEPLKPAQLGQRHRETEAARLSDLVSRLGNRIGFENVVRFLPAESHAPERAVTIATAAHSEPEPWAWTGPPRPTVLFPPEPVRLLGEAVHPGATGPLPPCGLGLKKENDPVDRFPGPGTARGGGDARGERGAGLPPPAFAWRNRRLTTLRAHGPERLAPEWWLDDPAWASGLRDYWRVETAEGPRLWLFHTPAARAAGPVWPAWYVHGRFA